MEFFGIRQLILWIMAIVMVSACSSSAPPAPPPSTPSSTGQDRSSSFSADRERDRYDDDDDDERDDDEEEEEGFDWDDCGAEVGDETTKDEVRECNDDGRFFDRFAGATGKCTRRKLAKVSCDEDAILDLLSKDQKKQFEGALEGAYDGYEIDQIADCPPDTSSDVCRQDGSGGSQVGTKIFFVKEEDTELLGKAMLLPFRPGQSGDDDDDDEDDDKDDDEDDEDEDEDEDDE